ncbi:MAG: 8-amino-7-oxononanoate synthase [Syntrophobacterales bacterium]|nr:8-amino-7-oxononanoate synthase [Syntrophobacterales bacterium]
MESKANITAHQDKFWFVDRELETRRASHRLRTLVPIVPISPREVEISGKRMISFASNDYLGLSKHPLLKERAIEYTIRYGTGATASRLVCGNYDCMESLEKRLAELSYKEKALILPSGFQTNVSLLPALADKDSLIISDELNHASIVLGCRLARCSLEIFPHNDYDALQKIISKRRDQFSRIIVVTESVFSMDGDRADIDRLVEISKNFSAIVVVDEAHAVGVLGTNGMGLSVGSGVDIIMGTFSKALGASGAYVACSEKLASYLINCCAGFIYSTAMPPPVIGAIDAALDLVLTSEEVRRELLKKADYVRASLKALGFNTGFSSTHIVPVIVGHEKEALDLSQHLRNKDIFTLAFRPPTVPPGTSRIRISLSASHSWEDIEKLVEALSSWTRL